MDLQDNNIDNDVTTTSNKPRKTKFEYEDEDQDETIDETVTESSNLDDDALMCDPDEIGGDKTSADYYFDSYSHFGIHEVSLAAFGCEAVLCLEMLKDTVRTKTYQNVIYKNTFLFKDKIVLDVGAGTGILSLFCAKAGAKHVYAVECSHMADMAQEIVKVNGFSDVITVLKGKVEEIELPVPQVDIIVSEWMGYFLLFENMLNTVLYARNKWLVNNGVVLPDKASLYLTAIEDAEYKEDKIEFWNNVYGFNMSCIKKQSMMEPLVDTVDQNQIVTNCQLLKMMDISKMAPGDASFTAPFKLVAERDDYIHALVAYFDVSFTRCHKLTGFSTGPRSRATHWKQTVLYLEDVLTVCEGEALVGSMTVTQNKKNPRDVDIMIKYSMSGRRCVVSRTQYYRMR
ncbi:probable protein arginine N-methyltransferase 1.2 isoform X1 [Actinidia eriantha]|uniref:probable protein arginine N-methyltransferase 1.2 isoform X1 n=1 Tax=Actinidia eriantha TaxID=165200 RepID=UPI00258CC4ED|nr:probable protein arginine N-methyltransferase 1.2 isoform X1 [Actinidia eriantha]